MAKDLIGALDLGSSKLKILIVRKKEKDLELVEAIEKDSEGIKKGIVVDVGRVSRLIKFALKEVKKIPPFFVNLSGAHLFSTFSQGAISISRADQLISEEDKERVLKSAETINLGLNKQVLCAIPQQFIVDGEKGIQEPVGLKGLRLETEALILGGFSQYIENVRRTIFYADLEAKDLIPSPLALGKAVLKEREREIGTCVLNFGADTTEIAVYKFGKLSFFKILPIGSSFITSRIAIFLKTDFETAERIKIEFGNCFGSSKKQKIEIGENLTLSFTLNSLARVIRESLGKILSEVKKTLKDYFKTQELPGGIVITGGGAKLRGICEFTRKRLSAYTRLGKPNFIFGLDPDPSFSLAVGLILEGLEMEKEFRGEGFFEKLKQFFKNFLP